MNKENRNYGIDIVRIIATILVLIVHFFLNTSYYETPRIGIGMNVQSVIRNFSIICVPLFLMLTGFLNKKDEYNKSFFKSLFNILIIWFFYSIIEYCTINIINKNLSALEIRNLIYSITSFKACGYSWYIEMYIGLYLISPIINKAYNNFNNKNRLYLLIISITFVILPTFINSVFNNLVYFPNWWNDLYPIAYYICGKYISDTKPKLNKKNLLFLIILVQILTFSYSYLDSIYYNSITIFITANLVFLMFYNIEVKSTMKKKILKYISSISLDIYLASSLIDKLIYPILSQKFMHIFKGIRQPYILFEAPVILTVVFILCIIYGSIRKLIINTR